MSTTAYPFRQALNVALQQIVTLRALPAINEALAALPGFAAATFSADSVSVGDLLSVSDPVLCLVGGGFDADPRFSDTFVATYYTNLRLKVPRAGRNDPEDFEAVNAVAEDVLLDVLNSPSGLVLRPLVPGTTNALLPSGMAFKDCFLGASHPLSFPAKTGDGVVRVRGLQMTHSATITFNRNRPQSLGAF